MTWFGLGPNETTTTTNDDNDNNTNSNSQYNEKEKRLIDESDSFTKGYIYFLSHRIRGFPWVAVCIIVILLAYGVFNSQAAVKLQPPKQQEKWFPDDHMFTIVEQEISKEYLTGTDDQYAKIDTVLGISWIDRGNFNKYIPNKNRGSAVFDDDFDLSHPDCQQVVLDACNTISTYSCSAKVCQPSGVISRTNTTKCFMTEFKSWSQNNLNLDTLTMNSTFFYDKLKEFRSTQAPVDDVNDNWKDEIGFINGDLKYINIPFTSTMEQQTSMGDKKDMKETADAMLQSIKSHAQCISQGGQCHCGSAFHSSFWWNWYNTELGLVIGFYQGMTISFPMAFIVLMFATGNIVLAIYAITSIFFIVFGVLGFVQSSLGWDLGVAESVAGIIIIGFSVDYTVHLGNEYMEAKHEGMVTRQERFLYSARRMISTVAAGAMTTGGAAIFLFPAQLVFFIKMATLMVATIILSYMYALGFFMSTLLLFGPEGNIGNIQTYLDMMIGKEKDKETRGDGKSVEMVTTS